jgi:hypothetical protein
MLTHNTPFRSQEVHRPANRVRIDLVKRVRAQVEAGDYDTDHRLEIAVDRMIEHLAETMRRPPRRQHRAA